MSNISRKLYFDKIAQLERRKARRDNKRKEREAAAQYKRDKALGDLNAGLALYNSVNKARLTYPTLQLQTETYGLDAEKKYQLTPGGDLGVINPLRLLPGGKDFEPMKLPGELIKSAKAYVSPIEETEGYKKFAKEAAAEELAVKTADESLALERQERFYASGEHEPYPIPPDDPDTIYDEYGDPMSPMPPDVPDVPVAEELAVDESIAYERLETDEDVWTPVTPPATEPEYAEIQRQAELYTPTVPAPPDYEKIEAAAELTRQMQEEAEGGIMAENWRNIETDTAPLTSSDPALEEALKGLENLDTPLPTGEDVGPMTAGLDFMPTDKDIPVTSGVDIPVSPDVEIPDAEPKFGDKLGKMSKWDNVQTGYQLFNVGSKLTDPNSTSTDRGVASVQAAKLLAELSAKKAGQQTVSQMGSKAFGDVLAKKGLQEGVKLTGKQTVGAVAGGALGGYTMVAEGKEAAESWSEGDYDEAILHGIGSVSGGLQTAGAGMMATGIGAPLGAVLYGVGTAGSIISGVGTFVEGLWGDDKAAPVEEVKKPRFSLSDYYRNIHDRQPGYGYRRY